MDVEKWKPTFFWIILLHKTQAGKEMSKCRETPVGVQYDNFLIRISIILLSNLYL